jgi:hypothetical protein
MVRFSVRCGLCILAAYLLGLVIPMQVLQFVCLGLMGLGLLFLFLFHLGIRDFQGY